MFAVLIFSISFKNYNLEGINLKYRIINGDMKSKTGNYLNIIEKDIINSPYVTLLIVLNHLENVFRDG